MKANTVIFDKDGTLIDFDAFWVNVTIAALKDTLKAFDKSEDNMAEILKAFKIENGKTDIDSVISKGTYAQMANIIYEILKKSGGDFSEKEVCDVMLKAYRENADAGKILPTCDNIREVLLKLKNAGKRLLVITTDDCNITVKCLKALNILDLFDKIFSDDGKTPLKPDPTCLINYCKEENIPIEDALMVGDTMTDMNFAKNAGICSIGVGEGRARLEEYATAVIPDISHIFEVLEV